MTAKQLSEKIGSLVDVAIRPNDKDIIFLRCTIIDCREVWGRIDYRVDYNNQQFWTNSSHVKFCE